MRIGMMADTYKPYVSGVTNYIDLNKRYLEKDDFTHTLLELGALKLQKNYPKVDGCR